MLVVSNEPFNQAMPTLTILPLTSTQRRLYPSEVLLAKGQSGQPRDSIVLVHQIRTISKNRVRRLLGHLDDAATRQRVRRAIRDHLDLD